MAPAVLLAGASEMPHGLIDEYHLFVNPGAGTPFFPALEDRIGLELLETRTFGSGVAFLRYEVKPATAPP